MIRIKIKVKFGFVIFLGYKLFGINMVSIREMDIEIIIPSMIPT